MRTPFPLSRAELDDIERGRDDADLVAVVEAARRAALAEVRLVFHGFKEGGVLGMADVSPHRRLEINGDYTTYPRTVARAVDFSLSTGQDFALGFATADGSSVQLYIEESIGFRVLTPEAAVPLVYAS